MFPGSVGIFLDRNIWVMMWRHVIDFTENQQYLERGHFLELMEKHGKVK